MLIRAVITDMTNNKVSSPSPPSVTVTIEIPPAMVADLRAMAPYGVDGFCPAGARASLSSILEETVLSGLNGSVGDRLRFNIMLKKPGLATMRISDNAPPYGYRDPRLLERDSAAGRTHPAVDAEGRLQQLHDSNRDELAP